MTALFTHRYLVDSTTENMHFETMIDEDEGLYGIDLEPDQLPAFEMLTVPMETISWEGHDGSIVMGRAALHCGILYITEHIALHPQADELYPQIAHYLDQLALMAEADATVAALVDALSRH